jgi:hypothetical protein
MSEEKTKKIPAWKLRNFIRSIFNDNWNWLDIHDVEIKNGEVIKTLRKMLYVRGKVDYIFVERENLVTTKYSEMFTAVVRYPNYIVKIRIGVTPRQKIEITDIVAVEDRTSYEYKCEAEKR